MDNAAVPPVTWAWTATPPPELLAAKMWTSLEFKGEVLRVIGTAVDGSDVEAATYCDKLVALFSDPGALAAAQAKLDHITEQSAARLKQTLGAVCRPPSDQLPAASMADRQNAQVDHTQHRQEAPPHQQMPGPASSTRGVRRLIM